jgi:polyhydroxybutyrate depolymerase
VKFLETVIDRCDAERAFVCGFSNGAGMAFRFASERAARVAAVAPVAGHCWLSAPNPARPVPTLFIIGTEDRLVPLRGGDVPSPWLNRLVRRPPVNETLEKWARANGCAEVPELVRDGAVRAERYPGPVRVEALTVEGLGHHWPGGRAQLNPRLAGPPSAALNATDAVWEFFFACAEPSLTLTAR